MKKFYLLSILLLGLNIGYSQIPVTLTFHAFDSITLNPVALDSVNIRNLTENCDTTLYDSVSVLNLIASWPVGIEEPISVGSGSFILMQNVPNPFQGSTQVRIWLKNSGELCMSVYNIQGKKLSEYRNAIEKGWHSFVISTSQSGLLFLKVSDNTTTKTIKLLSNCPGNQGDHISYEGSSGNRVKTLKLVQDSAGFIFYLGNQLQYTAYVSGYREKFLSDNPVSSETYSLSMRPLFVCGDSISINHDTSGGVAPVNKTVTYGTVTNIPGETSKCWITSNLGASHQATAKDDATEPSAGWYWQFNRKQGYKHDGSTRTPNTTWITTINEDSDWTSANDPCTLEMGGGWRIPTETEWTNVDASGNWTNWNGPWNSALKIHAAGYLLDYNNGSIADRGSYGYYWSSTQVSYLHSDGRNLGFGSGGCQMMGGFKAWGQSIRCIKE